VSATDLKPFMQNKWLIVLGVVGILCLLFGTVIHPGAGGAVPTTARNTLQSLAGGSEQTSTTAQGVNTNPTQLQENYYDQKLSTLLKQMSGVNNVSVMITLDATENQQPAYNSRTSRQTQSNGNQSSTTTSTSEDIFQQKLQDGSSVPFVTQSVSAKVRGVLVLVDAADFNMAKLEIVDAIQHVLDVPAYKISVEPQKSNS
jgi:stage III sporulation protein AG